MRSGARKKRGDAPKDRRKRSGRVGVPAPTMAESLASLVKGMTPDDVGKVLGQPADTDINGNRLLWHYNDDFDVVFLDGKLEKLQPRQ